MVLYLTHLQDLTAKLRESSQKLHKSAGRNYSLLFVESARGETIFNNHAPEQPFEGKLNVVGFVSNPVTGRARSEWSRSLGIQGVTRFPQHVISGEDLKTVLSTNAGFKSLSHTLFPSGKGVKGVFSLEVTGSKKLMNFVFASFKTELKNKGLVKTRGIGRNEWVIVTPNERLLHDVVNAYVKASAKRR